MIIWSSLRAVQDKACWPAYLARSLYSQFRLPSPAAAAFHACAEAEAEAGRSVRRRAMERLWARRGTASCRKSRPGPGPGSGVRAAVGSVTALLGRAGVEARERRGDAGVPAQDAGRSCVGDRRLPRSSSGAWRWPGRMRRERESDLRCAGASCSATARRSTALRQRMPSSSVSMRRWMPPPPPPAAGSSGCGA